MSKAKLTSEIQLSIPFLLFFLFYNTVSGILPLIAYLPFSIGYLIGFTQLSNTINSSSAQLHLYPQLKDYIVIILPIVYVLLSFFLLTKVKTARQFFWTTLVFLSSSYFLQFSNFLLNPKAYLVVVLLIPLFLLFTASLMFIWQYIFIDKRYKASVLLLIIFLFDVVVLKIGLLPNPSWIMNIYIVIGEFLNKITAHRVNIFFLDYSGFAIIFINFLSVVFALLLFLFIRTRIDFSQKKRM